MFNLNDELKQKVEKRTSQFYKVMKSCLKTKNEQILIIADPGSEGKQLANMLGYGYYQAARNKGCEVEFLFQEVKKGFMRADSHVISALENLAEGSIVILTVSNKLGRIGTTKSFRGFCKERNHRFLSSTGLGDVSNNHFDLFMEAININYSRMIKKGDIIKKKLNKAKEIRIKTDAGTDVTFNVDGMNSISNAGDYRKLGTGGNMPAGEVYIPPKGYSGVKGKVVIDGSMKTIDGTILLDSPVTLFIEEGRVVKLEGKHAPLLENTFKKYEDRAKYPYRIRHVCEIGIGINPGAVLIGSTIMDEKVLGTAHIAMGSNYWFGGEIKTIFHGDQIFKNPRIFLDGKKLEV
jgi:aminopeptidase